MFALWGLNVLCIFGVLVRSQVLLVMKMSRVMNSQSAS